MIKADAIGALNLLHTALTVYAFPEPNLQQFPGVTKLLKENIFVASS